MSTPHAKELTFLESLGDGYYALLSSFGGIARYTETGRDTDRPQLNDLESFIKPAKVEEVYC